MLFVITSLEDSKPDRIWVGLSVSARIRYAYCLLPRWCNSNWQSACSSWEGTQSEQAHCQESRFESIAVVIAVPILREQELKETESKRRVINIRCEWEDWSSWSGSREGCSVRTPLLVQLPTVPRRSISRRALWPRALNEHPAILPGGRMVTGCSVLIAVMIVKGSQGWAPVSRSHLVHWPGGKSVGTHFVRGRTEVGYSSRRGECPYMPRAGPSSWREFGGPGTTDWVGDGPVQTVVKFCRIRRTSMSGTTWTRTDPV